MNGGASEAGLRLGAWAAACMLVAVEATGLSAQQVSARGLSLAEALRIAEEASEQVRIARAGVMRTEGELQRARSEYFPQVFASASYTRTLASEFSSFSGGGSADTVPGEPAPTDCGTFAPDPSLPLASRVDSLEAAVRCQSRENPFDSFSDLPFGRENVWRVDLSVNQTLFSGGRVQAQARVADAGRAAAEVALTSARAQLMLDVARAYYDAALADRLLAIAESTLQQAESTLTEVRLAEDVGMESEFELLRAQVTRDTQQPLVIQRRANRDLAALRLKQLLNLPAEAALTLTTELDGADPEAVVQVALEVTGLDPSPVEARAPVQQAEQAVRIQEGLLTVAKSQRLPALSVGFSYGRVGYPQNANPFDVAYRTNSSVTATVQLPIFTGFRIAGEERIAQANADEARARLDMTRELASLDTRDAAERLAAAQSSWEASSGTVEQAERAYSIAQIRYREGISTQLEINDARILLQQAQANRAQAARDLQVARLRVALLPYLPLSSESAASAEIPATTVPSFAAPAPPSVVAPPGTTGGAVRTIQANNTGGAAGQR